MAKLKEWKNSTFGHIEDGDCEGYFVTINSIVGYC